jgi:hypothetical protein
MASGQRPTHTQRGPGPLESVKWSLVVGAVVLAAGGVLVGWLIVDAVDNESAGDDVGVTIENILEDTNGLLGESGSVRGRVNDRVSGAFTIGGASRDEQVVVLPRPGTTSPREREVVQIVGRCGGMRIVLGLGASVAIPTRGEY